MNETPQHMANSDRIELPLAIGKEYRGYVEYLLLKAELADRSLVEVTAWDGMLLTASLLVRLRSVWKGYHNYRSLEEVLLVHVTKGNEIVLGEKENGLVLSVR